MLPLKYFFACLVSAVGDAVARCASFSVDRTKQDFREESQDENGEQSQGGVFGDHTKTDPSSFAPFKFYSS